MKLLSRPLMLTISTLVFPKYWPEEFVCVHALNSSLCTAAPPLKKIGKERLWFIVDNRVQRPRDFFWNVWKMIWLVISNTSLHHWNSEIWPAFIFAGFAIGAFCTESSTFVRDNNMRTAHGRRSELHRRSRTFRTRLEDLHIRLFL